MEWQLHSFARPLSGGKALWGQGSFAPGALPRLPDLPGPSLARLHRGPDIEFYQKGAGRFGQAHCCGVLAGADKRVWRVSGSGKSLLCCGLQDGIVVSAPGASISRWVQADRIIFFLLRPDLYNCCVSVTAPRTSHACCNTPGLHPPMLHP